MRRRRSWSCEGGRRRPPAGCRCWTPDKREQISAAGSSNLSVAVPSCVTSQPSVGTGASLGTLTPPGPPGREGATDKTPKVGRSFLFPSPCCHPLPGCLPGPCLQGWFRPPGNYFRRSVTLSSLLLPNPYQPHRVLENYLQEMNTYAFLTAPLERKQRERPKPLII